MTLRIAMAGVFTLAFGPFASAQDKVDFEREVWPILETACIECHKAPYKDERGRTRNPKASLRLDGSGWIMSGSRTEKVVIPGDGEGSLLYVLTTLDPGEDGFMPRKRKPLTKAETEVLKRWIDEGAHFGKWTGTGGPKPVVASETTAEVTVPVSMSPIVTLGEGLEPLSSSVIRKAAGELASITAATKGGPLLRVSYFSNQGSVTDREVNGLLTVRDRVTQLMLGRTAITDRALSGIGGMKRLTKLDISNTKVTDRGLRSLGKLAELRSLNLYGTAITDRGLEYLAGLGKLRHVYLFETKVTEAGVEKLRKALPDAKIVRALVVPPPLREEREGNRGRRRRNNN